MIIAKSLSLQKFMQVSFHQRLHYVDIFHVVVRRRPQYVQDIYDLSSNYPMNNTLVLFLLLLLPHHY